MIRNMRRALLIAAVLILPRFVIGQDVNQILEDRLKTTPVGSSISAALIDQNGTKFYSTGKISKQPDASPADENTVYEIGSITKVFTGILLAEAIKRGEVKLDDPISKYLPANVKTPKFNGKEITLLDLTTQSSGLPSLPDDFKPKDPLNPYADYTVQRLYDFLGRVELKHEIGIKFEYSNLGVGLLGHILALQAKMSYEPLVKERILKPLGMNDTAIVLSPSMRSHLAIGHDLAGNPTPNWDLPTFAGAGALRSTASDMAKFVSANLGLTKTPISDSMAEAQKVRRKFADSPVLISFNWITTKSAGRDIIWHNGGTGGYRTFVGMDLERKKGVFVATNSADSVDDLGFHLLNSEAPLRTVEKPKTAVTLSEKILDTYVGEYQLSPEFTIVILREGGRLFAQATSQPRFELFAEKEDEFFVKEVPATVSFTKDENGRVTGLVLHQGGNNSPGKKVK
jgi:CubicO group peptidase (beta-lactamase class C family)